VPGELRTGAEIAQWITEQVRKSVDGQDFKLTGVIRLNQPAADGCNWTIDSVLILPRDCGVACNGVVAQARKKFNVA
jgi:predicted trehalose synthase